eukprot:6212517-Pleurochrysis_carterae.AAC.5
MHTRSQPYLKFTAKLSAASAKTMQVPICPQRQKVCRDVLQCARVTSRSCARFPPDRRDAACALSAQGRNGRARNGKRSTHALIGHAGRRQLLV